MANPRKMFFLVFVMIFFGPAQHLCAAAESAQEITTSAVLDGEQVTITLRSMDADCLKLKHIEIGRMACYAVTLKSGNSSWLKDLKLERFDMTMPAHRHGMVTRARVKAKNEGEYLIEGVKLHMPGDWEISMRLVRGKSSSQVAIPLKL